MSGLAAVLAGRHDAGVHLWHNALHVPDIQHAVEHAGWQFGYVDGVALETKKEVLGAIGAALDLPEHYGGNLDALRDCLRDLSKPTVLLWDGWGSLARAEPEAFQKVCRVLERSADDDTSFEVLLRGPGPTDGLDSLD
ncbi:barstar family protein [Nocardioides antri]|uniref:Barstar family protein n=1 Tax=Nocardioides antri TaxID=2607659 RepID=A0A5B1MAE8_9ACTN|nr:barstar family protein [Nocardioides antri]KAA1428979.1 barstar family protein [Nocardioides antri]